MSISNTKIWVVACLMAYKLAVVGLGAGPYLKSGFDDYEKGELDRSEKKTLVLSLISTIGMGINFFDNIVTILKTYKYVSDFIKTLGCLVRLTGLTLLRLPPFVTSLWILVLIAESSIDSPGIPILISLSYFSDYLLYFF